MLAPWHPLAIHQIPSGLLSFLLGLCSSLEMAFEAEGKQTKKPNKQQKNPKTNNNRNPNQPKTTNRQNPARNPPCTTSYWAGTWIGTCSHVCICMTLCPKTGTPAQALKKWVVLCGTIKPGFPVEHPWPCSPLVPAKAVENIWDHSLLQNGS